MGNNMRTLYRKSLRKEALEVGRDNVAPAERVKRRMAETKMQQAKALFDAMEEFLSMAEEKSAPEMIRHAKRAAELIPPIAEMYDSPAEVDFRIKMSDLYVWLVSLESAPSSKVPTAIDSIQQIYDDLSVEFSSGAE